MAPIFIGVDVGTGSARAGLFDEHGRLLASAKRPITIWHEPGHVVEQSSAQIWQAICASVREAVDTARIDPSAVAGIGFDATCSLVAIGEDGAPVTVSPTGDAERNIIVWMDHRATGEAAEINAGKHDVLRYVGGVISPEMETPKLLWLKRNLPQSFSKAAHFFDLADYLTWRATGSLSRSACTVTCKWTYLAHEKRWDAAYFQAIGLGQLADEGFKRIGTEIVDPGTALGQGLTEQAAADLGLLAGTPVGASLIDAHAGGIGTLGGLDRQAEARAQNRLAYIFGTSACSMASSDQPAFVDGVWGPYYSAMIPGLWLTEGGQSAAGAAIDHLVTLHPAAPKAQQDAAAEGLSLVSWLDREVQRKCADASEAVRLARDLHVVPEFLGNRSPHADPSARAIISGLALDTDLDSLVALYVAGLCGLGYGLRQLLDTLARNGMTLDLIVASGGAAQSPLVRQVLADTSGLPVAVAETEEPVLLGAAMLGATASARYAALTDAMSAMSRLSAFYQPATDDIKALHALRYRAFSRLQEVQRKIRLRSDVP
ncbi:FGGY-family carbohydrate kinase [Rhizobium sp. NTR19]|uniref:FGGY-family carbohydrate kinase n=1 Tax=Neorhizobium turbinariae TaxID=2937795 RepID=A0ABT0IPR5_9HYPH|nr:FGGY-family carbohydrate kinase [Neorhizobium turbinariae]MCK8779858.1 FGGY-family carbohydrate kinase [Neorhizobium turbinariae]